MATTVVNTKLTKEIKKFGSYDPSVCFNCGNCTAKCHLSTEHNLFPRKIIRYVQLGMKDKLKSSPEPWLCYYCGDCSATCPREANPGEIMMSIRRYLTSQYDWTGLSRMFYSSKTWELISILLIAFLILSAFIYDGAFNRMNMESVSVNTFAPVELIHVADLLIFILLGGLLISNALRMFYFIIIKDSKVKIPLKLYISEFKVFTLNAMTQMRWKECKESSWRWIKHLMLVTGYATMFLLVVVMLPIFQRDDSQWHWTAILGYYGTAVLLFVTLESMISRLRKKEELHKNSHSSDWLFLILLFLTALSGILLHLFRILALPLPTYYVYVIHLMIVGPMLIIEVPFGKWAHMLYRPLAIYLATVKIKAASLVS